jgi:hypothetical protein
MKTSNDQFPDEAPERIRYLMRTYGWCKFEAECYFFYEPFDENDWIHYD